MVEHEELLPLPQPPFDFDKEELVDVSVELCGDRLKGTVAWLVDCIQEQQQQLWSHEVRLGTIANTLADGDEKSRPGSRKLTVETSRPPSRVTIVEDGLKSPLVPGEPESETETGSVDSPKTPSRSSKPRKSVTQGLQDSMKDELLSMKVTKLQLELNTVPKAADLDAQREDIRADAAVLEDKLLKELHKGSDDVRTELASLTTDLYARLQRICDDVMKRLEDVESQATHAENRVQDLHQYVHVQLESKAAADSSVNVPMLQDDNDSVPDTVASPGSRGNRAGSESVPFPPGSREPDKRESDSRQSVTRQGPGDSPSKLESERPSTQASALEAFPRPRDDSNSVTYSEADPSSHQQHVNAVVTDPSIFDSAGQFTDVKDRVERNYQMCRNVDVQMTDLKGEMARLIGSSKDSAERIDGLEAEIDMMKQYVESLGDPAVHLDAMRKEWLGKAACRGDSKSASSDGTSPNPRMSRPKRQSEDASDPIVVGRIRPPSSEGLGAGSLGNAMAELNAEMDDIQTKINSMQSFQEAMGRLKTLEDKVSEHNEILLPMDQPDLGTSVSTFSRRVDELEAWKTATDKRIRRMNPLDSEFADVQNELERLRKLFEFVQQVLPSDAAQAMSFFTKSSVLTVPGNGQKSGKINSKDIGSKKGKQHSPLIDSVATSLGPEVAFEMQRAKLEDEVRDHEQAMRQEFANLTTAIKSLQREMQQTSGKTVDLVERVARVEGGVVTFTASQEQPQGQEASPRSSGRGAPPESRESLKSAENEAGRQDGSDGSDVYVSKSAMQQALKETRDDFRNWLDEWSSNFVAVLQKKADSNQVIALLTELQQTMGSAGLTTDTMALIAKRALLGRCASCDANLNVEPDNLKRNPPLPKPSAYPNRPSAGAPVSMRAPAGVAHMPQVLLPKILDSRATKDFPKSKIFKNPSAPDVRQTRMPEQSEENIQ
jgi:prefoldin subunit 5|mmetsp:Transcript_1791/g.3080  ORF Transcript_1791/g.3080 Transcript_1791/m.3080 type:complete len:945 (-) Transcript_1791:80-2914(-)